MTINARPVGLELDTDGDPQDHISTIGTWDKSRAESQLVYIEILEVVAAAAAHEELAE